MKKLIGVEIRALQNMIARRIEKSESGNIKERISGPNVFILKFLKANETKDIFQRDIEKVLETTKSTCSKVLSTMEGKGLIKRVPVNDARFNKICLTPLGEEILNDVDSRMEIFEENLKRNLTQEQISTFFYCIDEMKKNISDMN